MKRIAIFLGLVFLFAAAGGGLFLGIPRNGRNISARVEEAVSSGREVFGELAQSGARVASSVTGKPERAAGEGALKVFFAPVEAINPWGLDDYLLELIGTAKTSVLCAFYELQLLPVADALIARHLDGITVQIVSDEHYQDRDAVQRCMRAGIPVIFDNRSAFMHNKFCIVDGHTVWTGSTNITENGMYRNNNNALLITSAELAEDYTAEFLEMFEKKRFGGRSPRNTPHPLVMIAGISVECYFAPEDHVQREIVAEIREAAQTIEFMAFSFTSKEIAEAMAARMKEGIRVRGIFESRNVNSKSSRDDYLRERGGEIYLDKNPYTMHHKAIIIDAATVITGSYNFSKSAETENDENVLIIHDPETAKSFAGEFARLIQ